jgi:hypothetical protein
VKLESYFARESPASLHQDAMLAISIETIGSMIQEHEIFFEDNSLLSGAAITLAKQTSKTLQFQQSSVRVFI